VMVQWDEVPEWFARLSAELWRASRLVRARLHHGTRQCPARLDPFAAASSDEPTCAPCAELHQELLQVTIARARKLQCSLPTLLGRVVRNARSWALDARDRVDSSRGRATRLERLQQRKWFATAVPEPLDQRLVLDVLHFVRSGDVSGAYDLPFERLARRH